MSFLNWWAFWIAALVVPALLILYFLKLRRREERVPSTLLWKRAVQDLQVNAPFQRLRKNLLLFLQLLLLLAGIVALARPIVKSDVADERSLVLLIDRSASMNALEGQKTRLELAKEQAKRLVQTLNRRSRSWFSFAGPEEKTRCMLIALADRASVVSPFTTNTTELIDLIDGIKSSDARTTLREALELAEAYIMPTRGDVLSVQNPVTTEVASKLVLISDGRVSDVSELTLRYGSLELLKIGETDDNAGIIAMRAQRKYEQPQMLDVFVQVQNFCAAPVKTDVSLLVDGAIVDVQSLSLAAAARRPDPGAQPADAAADAPATQPASADGGEGPASASISFSLTLDRAAVVEARLSRADALLADNNASAVVAAPRKLSVLFVRKANIFLDSLLKPMALARLERWTPEQYESAPAGEIEAEGRSIFDVVVFDQHDTKRLPAGNYFFVAATPEIPEIVRDGEIAEHAMLWWDETHALLRHVALDHVYAAKGLVVKPPREAETLVEGPRGPVLFRYAADGRQYVVLTFPIEMSNWWQKTSFPVFLQNVVRYLGSGDESGESGGAHPGDTLRIPLPAGAASAQLIRPDSVAVPLRGDSQGVARYAQTDRVGVYQCKPGIPDRDRFAVNLEDAWESDIRPAQTLRLGAEAVKETQALHTGTPEIWRWFIGAALALALIEWYIYNRRVMI
ncbi:MAG: BatA and WFA domain-containing protein [Phycisphaerae bacterium]